MHGMGHKAVRDGHTDDVDLARRLRRKDPDAMAELYDRYGGLVYSTLLRMLRDRGTAEDQTQEVFLRVWNSIQNFDEERGGLGVWIVTIARNRAIDYLRSSRGQVDRRECELDESLLCMRGNNLEKHLLAGDLARVYRKALPELTDKQRKVIRLAFFEGKTHVEIAAEMQAPLGSVKTWARQGLRDLRKHLLAGPRKGPVCGATAY